jgi:hypothetical protein
MQSFLESFYNIQELTADAKFKDIRGVKYLKVFRSSARGEKRDYVAGSHCGTLQQALIRADYMINDEGKYDKYYLYELVIRVGDIYPKILPDDGSDHGYDYVEGLGDYDLAFYKNTGEGDIKKENLSVIIIDPDIVMQSKMIKILDGEYLSSIQDELYV